MARPPDGACARRLEAAVRRRGASAERGDLDVHDVVERAELLVGDAPELLEPDRAERRAPLPRGRV